MHPLWTGIGGLSTAAAVVLMAPLLDPPAPDSCEKLLPLTRPGTTITSAQTIDAGRFTPPNGRGSSTFGSLPAFCRVEATLKPAPDSEIKVEAWLPASGWNGRFQAVGNRGWGGTIAYAALGQAVAGGYATVSTATGHTGNGASFALGHPDKLVDSGSRAVHDMTAWAKKIVEAFYGSAPKFSYWNGCSLGGRQGFAEAQRFPADYDGIVAGDPANDLTRLYAARLAWAQAVHETGDSYIPPTKYPLIHGAVLAACDGLDGVKDGVLEDPTRCRFDPRVLECKREDAPECLTNSQVETARALYPAKVATAPTRSTR
jgi:feruloyl esterase